MDKTIEIENITLVREGEYLFVIVEKDGRREVVISEHAEGPISHCVHASGIRKAFA